MVAPPKKSRADVVDLSTWAVCFQFKQLNLLFPTILSCSTNLCKYFSPSTLFHTLLGDPLSLSLALCVVTNRLAFNNNKIPELFTKKARRSKVNITPTLFSIKILLYYDKQQKTHIHHRCGSDTDWLLSARSAAVLDPRNWAQTATSTHTRTYSHEHPRTEKSGSDGSRDRERANFAIAATVSNDKITYQHTWTSKNIQKQSGNRLAPRPTMMMIFPHFLLRRH